MKNALLALLASGGALLPETHTLTLRQVGDLALRQSPEALLARLDEQRAAQDIRVARDPFFPKIYAGSGLAYSNGFPMSIEGAAPSVVQARAVASVYNRQQRLRIAQANEAQRSTAADARASREKAMVRALELFLVLEHHQRLAELTRRQVESARKVDQVTRIRVEEGRELPLETKRTALELAKAEQRAAQLDSARDRDAQTLAVGLGFAPGDRIQPAAEERTRDDVPESEQVAVDQALAGNHEIRRLEAALAAKTIEVRAERAARYPQLDLVAQYGLFARFNNYEDFFRKFQRHNGQIGVSLQVPLLLGPAVDARTAQAETDLARLRIEINHARNRARNGAISCFQDLRNAERMRHVARLDLEVAREQLSVELARLDEGRTSPREVEQARIIEQEKWIAYWDAQHLVDRMRLALLESTGQLMAAWR
jgi:outer membrane protein TolC